jgi:hypothetical protein
MPDTSGAGLAVTALNKILGFAGVLLLLVGVLLGFRSVSAGGTDCGSAFQPAAGITPMACDKAVSSSSTLVTIVIIAGALSLVTAIALKVVRDKADA